MALFANDGIARTITQEGLAWLYRCFVRYTELLGPESDLERFFLARHDETLINGKFFGNDAREMIHFLRDPVETTASRG